MPGRQWRREGRALGCVCESSARPAPQLMKGWRFLPVEGRNGIGEKLTHLRLGAGTMLSVANSSSKTERFKAYNSRAGSLECRRGWLRERAGPECRGASPNVPAQPRLPCHWLSPEALQWGVSWPPLCLHFLAPLSCHLALLLEDLCALLSLGLVLTPFLLDTGSGDLGSPHMCVRSHVP